MIKTHGDKKVETWTHDTGLTTDIYLRGTRFVCTFLEQEFSAPDISILRKGLKDYATHWITMEWHPIIEVKVKGEGRDSYYNRRTESSIELETERFYLSISPAGALYRCAWDVDEEHRKASMEIVSSGRYTCLRDHDQSRIKIVGLPLKAPLSLKDEGAVYLDYTEAAWEAFEAIKRGINQLRSKLADLIKTKQGMAKLIGGERLLLQ